MSARRAGTMLGAASVRAVSRRCAHQAFTAASAWRPMTFRGSRVMPTLWAIVWRRRLSCRARTGSGWVVIGFSWSGGGLGAGGAAGEHPRLDLLLRRGHPLVPARRLRPVLVVLAARDPAVLAGGRLGHGPGGAHGAAGVRSTTAMAISCFVHPAGLL